MNSLIYIFRFLFRIRYWLIIPTALVTLLVVVKTARSRAAYDYESKTTIYTGVVSGYDIESNEGERQDWNVINNAMDNLINIITAQTTLKRVSIRLYARSLVHGDPEKDNNYIRASNYRKILRQTPDELQALVDRNSEQKTVDNFIAYEKATRDNHIFQQFNYHHPHYSYEALSKITVKRLGNSDMLEVKYVSDDPGITYNTLDILNEEFVDQYQQLRFGETNNVIAYFEAELERTGKLLRESEDSLTNYNVDKRVINYDEQTKHIAALSRDYELRYESILLDYNGADKLTQTLESRIAEHVAQLKNNQLFINKLNAISNLTARKATLDSFQSDSLEVMPGSQRLQQQIRSAEKDLAGLIDTLGVQKYTKEGLATQDIVNQWLAETIRLEKAKAELQVMKKRKEELDFQYTHFSPIGSTIKRKEREIGFIEQSYLSILHSLNAARLKKKSLQMTSATLKIINPPVYPLTPMPTKRKMIVAMAFFGTLLFVLGYFILLELLDRTLRDKNRTERITSGKVLGAFPAPGRFRYRSYTKTWQEIAARVTGNALLDYFKPKKPNIVNLLSTDSGNGKSFLAEQLAAYWESTGLSVKHVSWHRDFSIDHRSFLLAAQLADFYKAGNEDIVLVEYPPLSECPVPKTLLQEASVNLLVTRADRVWKETDQLQFDKLQQQVGDAPLFLYLNQAGMDAVETFTGMLPPFTRSRRIAYQLYQFGLTASSGK